MRRLFTLLTSLAIIGGIIIIAIYYSWYHNELSKMNYQFKKDIDTKRLADKKGD